MKKLKELAELFYIFFKLGFVSFGGGLAILKIYNDELVKKRKFLTEEELIDYYALCQTIPGIIIINLAFFIGNKRNGLLGMIATMLGVITPCIFIIVLIASNMSKFMQYDFTQNFLQGINIAICSVITVMTIDIARKNIKSVVGILIAVAAFVSLYFFDIPIYIVILGTVIISLFKKDKEGKL